MTLEMFAVYDSAVEAFMTPFFARSKGEALRSFIDACSDGKTNFCRHPEHFALYLVGSFDDDSGRCFVSNDMPSRLLGAREAMSAVDADKLAAVDYSAAVDSAAHPVNGGR